MLENENRELERIMRTTAVYFPSFLTFALALLLTLTCVRSANADQYWIYFGTSTGDTTQEQKEKGIPRSEGIYVGKFDSETGAISDVRLALKAASSGYLATAPGKTAFGLSEPPRRPTAGRTPTRARSIVKPAI